MRTKLFTGIGAATAMLILIFDSRTAFSAASDGIALCLRTLIPSLFPFFVFSTLLTSSLEGSAPGLISPLEKALRIPGGSASLLIIGLLGGYPSGAACIRQAYDRGQLSRQDAVRMLWFCNNAGPSFLFGVIAPFFPEAKYIWALWIIHILSALTVGMIIPGIPDRQPLQTNTTVITLPEALERSLRTMASVCGWVVMFRLILSLLDRVLFPLFPIPLQVLLKGITELTNGCILLKEIPDIAERFLTASVLIGFGGFCVLLQTKSVIRDLPLSPCFFGKILQAGFSFLYSINYLVLLDSRSSILSPASVFPIDLGLFVMLAAGKCRKFIVAFRQNMVYNRCNVQKTR